MTTSEFGTGQVGSRPVRVFGEVVTRKVASEQTGGAYTLYEAVVRPGRGVPPHIHHREDECFYEEVGQEPGSEDTHTPAGEPPEVSSIAKAAARYGIEISLPRNQQR